MKQKTFGHSYEKKVHVFENQFLTLMILFRISLITKNSSRNNAYRGRDELCKHIKKLNLPIKLGFGRSFCLFEVSGDVEIFFGFFLS